MKKIILCGSALLLSLGLLKAQTPGAFATYAYDDFQNTTGYVTNNAGLFYYSGAATVATQNGDRSSGTKSVFTYTTATTSYLSVDFGHTSNGVTLNTLNLATHSMADIEVDIKNTSPTLDLNLRVYLKDTNGVNKQGILLEIEPNVSDCNGVPDFATPTPGVTWTTPNLVYPAPSNLNAVYPTEAYNGFVVPANTRKTYRIDLSSVPSSLGGLNTTGAWGSPAKPSNAPITSSASSAGFDITAVHVVEFVFNENTSFTLSDGAVSDSSYLFDASSIAQSNYTGSIELYSFKVGSILPPLPSSAPTTAITDAVVNASLKVFPNPAKEVLNVSFDATTGGTISLSDLAGHSVYTTSATAGTNNMTINTSSVPTGMYILNIITSNGVAASKVSIR